METEFYANKKQCDLRKLCCDQTLKQTKTLQFSQKALLTLPFHIAQMEHEHLQETLLRNAGFPVEIRTLHLPYTSAKPCRWNQLSR
jgi:hypothetical protein